MDEYSDLLTIERIILNVKLRIYSTEKSWMTKLTWLIPKKTKK